MNRDEISILLVSAECEHAIGDERDAVRMLSMAFEAAKCHYMITDEEQQFKGALNAVLKKMGSDHSEKDRLTTEIKLLSQMGAWVQALQQGLSVNPPEIPEGFEAFGVRKMWTGSL